VLGRRGLREVGERSHALAEHARRRLGLPPAFDRPTLREFVVRTGRPAREVIAECKRRGCTTGYAIGRGLRGPSDDALMMAFTERRTPDEIEAAGRGAGGGGVEVAA